MKRIRFNTALILLSALLVAAAGSTLSGAELHIEGDRLSLTARHEPVTSVLMAFARQGVRVKVDPTITNSVTINVRRQDAETVLKTMLADCDYMALWKRVPGPLGPIPVLDELQVYRPGRKEAIRPLPSASVSAPSRVLVREFMAGELLVRVSPNVSPEQFLALIAQHGGRVADSVPSLGIYKIVFPPDTDIPRLAEELVRQGMIASAEPNYVYRLPAPGASDGAASASFSTPGKTVRPSPSGGSPLVAVLDTGFGVAGDPLISWLDAAGASVDPVDLQGHGTQMSLLAEGLLEPLGSSPADLNPLLPVLSVRISGQGSLVAGDVLMKSLQAAIDQNVRVVSLSWGSDMPSSFLKEQLEKTAGKGIVVVAAAGNVPSGNPVYPAAFPGVLAVGGTGPDGKPAAWSNYGDFLSFSAPGYVPLPPTPAGTRQMAVGTSVSTAYAANVLGQYFRLHPEATPSQAQADLKAAVSAPGSAPWDPRYGDGLLDAAAVKRFLKP